MDSSTLFVVAITTAKMIMPGMPAMDKIPGMSVPGMGAPDRTLTMTLTSDKSANAKSTAECAVPAGLKIGPKAILDINLPQKSEGKPERAEQGSEEAKASDFTIKMYWKSSKTVLEGQPKVIDVHSMPVNLQKEMTKSRNANIAMKRAWTDAYDDSYAYWPGRNAKKISKDSACPGDYTLETNYCGGTSITFDKPQDFLAAIDLTSPGKNIDLTKYIKVEWKPVPNAAAYLVNAMAMKEKLMVMWTSASSPEQPMDMLTNAISKEQLQKFIKSGTLLPDDQTICYIPEAIFKEMGNPMLTVTALGTDKIQNKDGIETQVVVRSNAMLVMGMMGMGGEDMIEEEEIGDLPEVEDEPVIEENPDKTPNIEEEETPAEDSGDALDKADETLDKADKVKDIFRKGRNIFKR